MGDDRGIHLIRECCICGASVWFNEFSGQYEYGCECSEDDAEDISDILV